MAANASTLPFADNSFDVVINEAMLTMYADKAKAKLIAEYYRVLKPGGRLLTHDIMFTAQKLGAGDQGQLVDVVKSNVSPMTRQGWRDLFLNCGFEQVLQQNGNMSLMSPRGLIRDEGLTHERKSSSVPENVSLLPFATSSAKLHCLLLC